MKNQNGITLIALVITIIVLLILAGVSIAMLSGDNGLLKRAKEVETESARGNLKEAVKLAVAESYMNATHPGTFALADVTAAKIIAQNKDLTNVEVSEAVDNGKTGTELRSYVVISADNVDDIYLADDANMYDTEAAANTAIGKTGSGS